MYTQPLRRCPLIQPLQQRTLYSSVLSVGTHRCTVTIAHRSSYRPAKPDDFLLARATCHAICMSVDLLIQYAKRMDCIILSSVACLALAYFSTSFYKQPPVSSVGG